MSSDVRIADFKNPPIAEVVLGTQFERVPGLSSAFQGLFWSQVRDDYPTAQDAMPLPLVLESSESDGVPPLQNILGALNLGGAPAVPRVFLLNQAGQRLIQLQQDRFHHNWRKTGSDGVYPHYEEIRDAFVQTWSKFASFCETEGLARPRVRQYELTYVNHAVDGETWSANAGLKDIFPWFAPTNPYTGDGEGGFGFRWTVPECRGRLHMSARMARRNADNRKLVVFEFTLRGAPENPGSDVDLTMWLDAARKVIVRSFLHLTSEKARLKWGELK